MYSLKKFKHLDNNYMLVQLDDKVKNNFLSSFLIGIDNKFLKLDTTDLNESTDYYKNKLNDKVVKKFDGKKFNKLNKKHLTYLADLCKMNLVIFDLDKLDLKFSTDLNKKNKTVYLFKHGKKEYLLMKQNMRGMVSKLPVGIYEQFGGMPVGDKRPRVNDSQPKEQNSSNSIIMVPRSPQSRGDTKRSRVVPPIEEPAAEAKALNEQMMSNIVNDDSFDILQQIIYDDKLVYYNDRVERGNDFKKDTGLLESYYFTVPPIDNESKSQGGMDVFVNNQQNFQQKGNHNEGFENKAGGGNYNNGKGDNYNQNNRVNLIRYRDDPEHDFNKLLPRNKSVSNLFLSLFNFTYFYNKSQYTTFTNEIGVNSEIENSDTINKSNIEDLYLKDIINNDANFSFLTYKTDVKEFLNIFNKIKNKTPNLTDAENSTLSVFKSKINNILNKFEYYEYDALNVTNPLSEDDYSGKNFNKYDSLCSIIDGGGVESVDVDKNDANYYNELYDSYFNNIKVNIVEPDFTIKLSYLDGKNLAPPINDKKFLQVKMSMPSNTIYNFTKGGFKVDNLACMMMMIENTTDDADDIKKNEMFSDNNGLNQLYDFINHIWIHKDDIFMPGQTITTKKQYLYGLLFTLKVIGDQGQADFVAKWNNNVDKKMIIVTGDRMLFHYCIIKGIPVYFQNKDYIIINTNESIYENIYKELTGFDTSLFPAAPDTATSVPAKDNFCIIRINKYIDDLIVAKGENFYDDLRGDITRINEYGTENLENFNEVIYNNDDVLFCEELDEIKDKVIENYLIKYENNLIDYIKNIENFENIINNKDKKFNEKLKNYIIDGGYKIIINYIKSKIITIYDINYTKFLELKNERNHNEFIIKLQIIIEKEMENILSTIEEMSIGLLFAGKRMASYRKKTNHGSIDKILNDIINTTRLESTGQKLTNELELIVLIIYNLVSQNNILIIEYLKETYLEYLKERLIKIKKNERFNEKLNIIIDTVPDGNKELLKEFIRKRVEYKFVPPMDEEV